ncbi:MAG TPA: hypothetical protein VH913_16840 [Hyphomicrobiaceae bacterium]|jgi:hypothetical protein
MLKDADPGNEVRVNAYSVQEFCRRNQMGVTTAYRANKAGFLEFTKQFNRTLITVEAEAKFRRLAAEGKLVFPKSGKPSPKQRAEAKRCGSPEAA